MSRIAASFALLCILFHAATVFANSVVGRNDGGIQPRQSVPANLPGTWKSQGCYTDVASARTLGGANYVSTTSMTVESCIAFCNTAGYHYAGVEYAKECFCDYALQVPGATTNISECNMPCTGDHSQSCGAGNRINIYYNGAPLPTVPAVAGTWIYIGCWTDDNPQLRTLIREYPMPGGATNEACQKACDVGWNLAGTEYGSECHCSGGLYPTRQVPENECAMACNGNSSQFCGGRNRINIYRRPGSVG